MSARYPVYVVEDDLHMREFLKELLAESGIEAAAFETGESFLEALEGLAPGCVLLDMRLPRKNGLQVQAEIMDTEREMPVVAISAYGGVDTAVQSMKLGAVEFLQKPFAEEALFDALHEGFGRLDAADRAGTPPA